MMTHDAEDCDTPRLPGNADNADSSTSSPNGTVPQHDHAPDNVTLAVVLCTRNRPESLCETLESIWIQTRIPNELIVIDDGDLPTEFCACVAKRSEKLGIHWQYTRKEKPGLTRSRNLAADIAKSEVLLYLDDDATCDRHCVAEIARLIQDPLITGVTANVHEPSLSSRAARLYLLGYHVAGWWAVRPRGTPKGPRPKVLGQPDIARRARWLSGAAMALRRDIVQKHRFDEELTEYALGEDREMGYRLMPHHWLLEAKRAHVTHRREETQRTNARRLGFMTTHNTLYILKKTCRLGAGDWLLIGWSFAVLMCMHVAWTIIGDRRAHLNEFLGMWDGIANALKTTPRKQRFHYHNPLQRSDPHLPVEPNTCARKIPAKKRVLFVTTRLDPGGAELMLMTLARRLPEHGIEPLILGLKSGGSLIQQCHKNGIPVFDGLLKHKADVTVIRRLQRFIAEHKIDVVTVAHSGGDRMFWTTLAGHVARVPVVVWSHWFPTERDPHFERANKLLYRWVDAYVALGERHRHALIRHAHVPAGRIHIIRNAIELAPFNQPGDRARIRRELRLDEHHVAIGIIANLRDVKRHDVFINAAKRLSQSHDNLRFFVAGDGPDRENVAALAAASGLDRDTLRLLGRRDDIPALLAGLDISCLCSDVECFSVGMLEAAAAGCAFIGPNVGAMPEFLHHQRTGLATEPANIDSLADAMGELTRDAKLRLRLADAAREQVLQGYTADCAARDFSVLFSRLCGDDRAGITHHCECVHPA